ncbi:MAG: ROK family protein, partial [Spirochaetales bacterium]
QITRGNPEALTAEIIFDHVRLNDPLALSLRDTACLMLARVLGQILNLLSPSLIVLCGGVMKSADLILRKVVEYLPEYSLGVMRKHCEIKAGELGPDAGVIGAAAYALMQIRKTGDSV